MVKNTRGNGEVPTSTDIYINTRGKGCKYIFLLFRYVYIVSLPKIREWGAVGGVRNPPLPRLFSTMMAKNSHFLY